MRGRRGEVSVELRRHTAITDTAAKITDADNPEQSAIPLRAPAEVRVQ